TGKQLEWDGAIGVPAICLRDCDKRGPGDGTIYADPFRVRTKMATAGETIAAMSASDVAFADDEIARRETLHVIANKIDNASKFVPDGHRHGDRFLRPSVPVIDVYVCSADGSFGDPNQHVIAAYF